MTDGHGQVKGVDKLGLELLFPKTRAIAIATATSSQDQQFWRRRIESLAGLPPPVDEGIDGKLSRSGGKSDVNVTLLMLLVIEAIGDSPRRCIRGKVVHVELRWAVTQSWPA